METIRDIGYRDELARLTPNLRRYARALVRNHSSETADELVQTTLTRALGGDQARRGPRLMVWLVSILTGLHREQVRDIGAEQKPRLRRRRVADGWQFLIVGNPHAVIQRCSAVSHSNIARPCCSSFSKT